MTTFIDDLLDKEYNSSETDSSDDDINLSEVIMDMSQSLDKRIKALEEYYIKEGDNAIEVLSTLSNMYQMNGSKLIAKFFYRVCTHSQVSTFLKLEAANSLLEYENIEENSEEEEENTQVHKSKVKHNTKREILGYKALDYVCYDMSNIPTPCRVEAIFRLMSSNDFQTNADAYFREFVRDEKIECDFRYKTILSLEKVGGDLMKKDVDKLFSDKEFVIQLYKNFNYVISNLFPNIKPNPHNRKIWNKVLFHLSYDEIRDIYITKFPDKPVGRDFFIRNSQLTFLFHQSNIIYYRILSAQYLLQKCNMSETCRLKVETEVLNFARNKEIDYNRRADAADVLIKLGSEIMKQHGKNVIMELSKINGKISTVFNNAQNVHTEKVEESVAETLEFLNGLPLYKVNKKQITFTYVNNHIEKIMKEEREYLYINRDGKEKCKHCDSPFEYKIENKENKFCSTKCFSFYSRDEKIRIALNRIFIDRTLYSKYTNTLINILLKVYTYIVSQDDKNIKKQMYKRLLEELEEMSDTCSSGFASRLINVISGFGQFNIRISYEDQIVASFNGRLNALARNITNENSIFRNQKINDVIELWLNREENKEERQAVENELNPSCKLEKRPKINDMVDAYLSKNRAKKVEQCVQDFSEAVINEMTTVSSNYADRQNFTLFFRTYVSIIREELADEYKNFISDTDFDLYFRKALIVYEGDL